MELVYYFDKELGESPVNKYLSQYLKKERDLPKIKKRKEKLLADIDAKIRYVFGNGGKVDGRISFPMRKYKYFKIKHRKNEELVIRICYFCHNNKLVLLSAFEKPDNYDKESEERAIRKELDIADNYRTNFISNPKLYEEYK
jgi:hypothetical protein